MESVLKFKYRDVNESGQVTTARSKRGAIEEDGIHFKNESVPSGWFVRAKARSNRAVLFFQAPGKGTVFRIIEVQGTSAANLSREFNRIASHAQILNRHAALEKEGRAAEIRSRTCAACDGLIDLTDFAETPEVYCPYCDTVSNDLVAAKEQERIRVCDQCGFYASPRRITCMYIILNYFRWQHKHMCSPCMRREGWKMLAGNFIFVLGIPVAVTQLLRAHFGGTARGGAYRGLEGGNLQARKKRIERASERYAVIEQRLGASSVTAFNTGVANVLCQRLPEAQKALEAALRACANSTRAADVLIHVLKARGLDPKTSAALRPFLKAETDA